MNRKDLDESADISLTEDDTGLDRSLGLVEVTAKAEVETEMYREETDSKASSRATDRVVLLEDHDTKQGAQIGGTSSNSIDRAAPQITTTGDLTDGSNPRPQAGEIDSAFKKVKDQPATKQTTQQTSVDPRQAKTAQKDPLQSIEEESRSNVSSSYQSIVLDQSAVLQEPILETDSKNEAADTLASDRAITQQTGPADAPKDAEYSNLDETQKGYSPELDFGASIDHRDQLESSLIAPGPGGYESILNPLNLAGGQPNELSQIVDTLKSSKEMIDMDQELSSLPESKEVAEEFPPLRHLLEHQEYSHSGQHFAIGDESVLLISQSKTQVHVHHISSRFKPFVLFSNKSAKVSEVYLVKAILSKTSVALISFELEGRHFVSGKGIDEENFTWFDCKFVYEVPSKPSLFRSKLNWAGFAFKRTKAHNEDPRIVLLDFRPDQFKALVSSSSQPQALVAPAIIDLNSTNSLDSIVDLAISTKDGLSLAVAPLSSHDPSFGGRIIVFNPVGQSREFSIARYKDSQEEGDGVVMVDFLPQKFASSSQECFLVVEDSEGYIFTIRNRTVSGWKADLIQRFSIISGLTGPNSQPLQRSEVFLANNNLIVFRSSAYWMLAFKLDEDVNSSGVGSAHVVGQARFRTNLTYCGYSIHQTSTKQAICVGRAFPEHKGNYLVQNLVGLSRNDIYKEPTLIRLQDVSESPKIRTPEEKVEIVTPVIPIKSEAKPQEPQVAQPVSPPETQSTPQEHLDASIVERATGGLLELGLGSGMTGEQFFDKFLGGGEPSFGLAGLTPEPLEELSQKGSKEPVDDGQVETKSVSASDMMKELIWGSNSQEAAKPVQNTEPSDPNDKAPEGGRHVAQNASNPAGSKKPHDPSTSQGKHQNSRKPEEQKPTHKSKDSIQKSGNYNSKTSSGNGIYKPKTEVTTGSSQQTYVPVNQTKVTQPATTKAPSAKHKLTPAEDKDSKDKDYKGGKNRSKTPATKNFGPRGTSTSSEEKYEPKHPQQLSQASPGQQDVLQSFGGKFDQNNNGHSAQTNGSGVGQKVDVSTISTPAFRASESADIAQLRRLALGEDSAIEEGTVRTMERVMLKVLDSLQHQSPGQTRANLPDNFDNLIREIFERVCEEKLINSMKTKFECMLSNSFNEAFEELMIPIFEKYLSKVFDKTGQILEKGLRFYSDKISIEERKVSQFKEQFNQMTTQFLTHSKAFNKLCQDMSQTKKDLESGQSKELSKRVSMIEESVEKMKEKQDTMLEILMRLDQRSKQQEEDKKSEQAAAPTAVPASVPTVQTNSNMGTQQHQLHIEGQGLASSLLQRPSDPSSQISNQQLANLLLNSLSHPAGNQRSQQAPASVHTLLPGLPGGHNQMSAPHYATFAPNQSYVQHQNHQGNGVNLQALQQLIQRTQQPPQSVQMGNSGMYSTQSNQSLDNSLNGSMILPGGGSIYQDNRQMHPTSQAVAEAEMLDRLVRLTQPR